MNESQEFKLPDVGEGLTEAEIVTWHVMVGDTVAVNDTLVDIETAKSVVELPCPFAGVVQRLHVEEGATVGVGTTLVTIHEATSPSPTSNTANPNDAASDTNPSPLAADRERVAAESTKQLGAADTVRSAPLPSGSTAKRQEGEDEKPQVLVGPGPKTAAARRRRLGVEHPAAESSSVPTAVGAANAQGPASTLAPLQTRKPVLVKPQLRLLAKQLDVDLEALAQEVDGLIGRADIERAAARSNHPAASTRLTRVHDARAETATGEHDRLGAERETRIPVKGVRKVTAEAMQHSAFTAPHVTEWLTVDITSTMNMVRTLKRDPAWAEVRVNPMLFVARAFVLAIRDYPDMNASWDEVAQEIVLKHYVNLGIAAATPRGLLVPNIKDADAMDLRHLAAALNELVTTARSGTTSRADMSRGTVTITNIGALGVDAGTPILNPGEAAILAFGSIRRQPWVVDGAVAVRDVTTLTISFDHRLIDGELGSNVLARVGELLHNPGATFLHA